MEGTEDDLADLPRYGVEDKEEEDDDQRQQQQQHQDAPVPAPDEEDKGLQWVHKPVEGGFGATVKGWRRWCQNDEGALGLLRLPFFKRWLVPQGPLT